MKCYGCGVEIPTTVKFCPKCGKPQQITTAMIKAAENGDQNAIADLYNRTYNSVYRSIRILVKDDDTILDILQDSYIKGFQSLNQLDRPENFPAWMKRIAANKAKDYLKKKKPVLFTDLGDEDESPELSFVDDNLNNLPDHVIDQQETTRLIDEILDSLSAEQRLAISLFYYDELSVKEIAEIMECSENTVKSRLNYGRKKIEAKVLELEKQGTKLYSLAPLPFLVWLLKGEAGQAAVAPSKAVLQAIGQECAHIAAGTAKTTAGNIAAQSAAKQASTKVAAHAAKSAVKAAVGTATKGVATKVTASILAVTLIGGGTAAVMHSQNKEPELPEPSAIIESTIEEPEVTSAPIAVPDLTNTPAPTTEAVGMIGDYVTTRREEHIDYDTSGSFAGLNFGESYDFWLRVPEILLDSEDARQCNQEIADQFDFIIDEALTAQSQGTSCAYTALDYDTWMYDGIVTVVVSAASEYGDTLHGVYLIDTETGERLTNTDLAEKLGLSDNYIASVQNAMQAKFEELFGVPGQYEGKPLAVTYESQLERTLAQENLENTVLYPAEDGTLMICCRIYSLAGAESYDYLVPVDITSSHEIESIETTNDEQIDSVQGTQTSSTVERGVCGENVEWSYSNGVLTLTGQGETSYMVGGESDVPWSSVRLKITEINVEDGVTYLSPYIFRGTENLERLYLPTTITWIDYGAFKSMSKEIDIYYDGSQDQWNQIKIDNTNGFNDVLISASMHFEAE